MRSNGTMKVYISDSLMVLVLGAPHFCDRYFSTTCGAESYQSRTENIFERRRLDIEPPVGNSIQLRREPTDFRGFRSTKPEKVGT